MASVDVTKQSAESHPYLKEVDTINSRPAGFEQALIWRASGYFGIGAHKNRHWFVYLKHTLWIDPFSNYCIYLAICVFFAVVEGQPIRGQPWSQTQFAKEPVCGKKHDWVVT